MTSKLYPLDRLNTSHIFHMVQCMYRYERTLKNREELLNDDEVYDFYLMYMGSPL
jgi:hypothetical protein